MSKKSETVGIRVSKDLYDRLQNASEITGVEPAGLGRACLEALVYYIEKNQEITLPIKIISKTDQELFDFYKKSAKR